MLPVPIPTDLEPVAKLAETVAKTGLAFYEPIGILLKGKAEASVIVEKAKAEAKASTLKTETEIKNQKLLEAAQTDAKTSTLKTETEIKNQEPLEAAQAGNLREVRRHRNIISVVGQAAKALPSSVNEKPVDEDWIFQFFDYCEDVGNEEMQVIWGRLLAGEVANPGTFSPRTLAVVRVLRVQDAMLFRLYCDYLWESQEEGRCHIYTEATDKHLVDKGLGLGQFFHLANLGLINVEPLLVHSFAEDTSTISYFGKSYLVKTSILRERYSALRIRPPTDIGTELALLCKANPDDTYRKLIIDEIARNGALIPRSDPANPTS